MIALCAEAGLKPPDFRQDAGSFVQTLWRMKKKSGRHFTGEVAGEVTGEVRKMICVIQGEMSRKAIQSALGLRHEEHFRMAYLVPALEAGYVEMTVPQHPQSSRQAYRLTAKGLKVSNQISQGPDKKVTPKSSIKQSSKKRAINPPRHEKTAGNKQTKPKKKA